MGGQMTTAEKSPAASCLLETWVVLVVRAREQRKLIWKWILPVSGGFLLEKWNKNWPKAKRMSVVVWKQKVFWSLWWTFYSGHFLLTSIARLFTVSETCGKNVSSTPNCHVKIVAWKSQKGASGFKITKSSEWPLDGGNFYYSQVIKWLRWYFFSYF